VAPLILGSITHLTPGSRGQHVLTGSHGGTYTGSAALVGGVASLICHDAGIGLEAAGIAGLALLEDAGIPAAAVDFRSARIGDADDMLARGVLSHANAPAAACSVVPGMAAAEAFARFQATTPRAARAKPPKTFRESRSVITLHTAVGADCAIVAADSAALIGPEDAGRIVVTGSHGGLPGGNSANAVKAAVRLAVFNDAGVGIDKAGIGRLPALDARGIAGLTVAALSARIGDARSAYQTGVISHVNETARGCGALPGQTLRGFLRLLADQLQVKDLR